jgi:hypothetical protein
VTATVAGEVPGGGCPFKLNVQPEPAAKMEAVITIARTRSRSTPTSLEGVRF